MDGPLSPRSAAAVDGPEAATAGSHAPALAFFEQVAAASERAIAAAGGPTDRYFAVAGRPVRLRFAGPALLPFLTPALAHLATGPAPSPDLTVCIWDSASTGVAMPPPSWRWPAYGNDAEIQGFTDGPIHAAFQFSTGIFSMLDRSRRLAIYWVKRPAQLPIRELAAPLRSIFQWWAGGHGTEQVHAAAVGLRSGGVLLPGKGGSGKSNTALACLASDLSFAGDDFCLVSPGPAPAVHSLYSTAKTLPQDLTRLPFVRPWASVQHRVAHEKLVYFLNDHVPERLTAGFPLRAILVPRITGGRDTRITGGSPAAALTALAPSSLILTPSRAPVLFRALAGLVRTVPCYTLELGTDPAQIPAVILRFLLATSDGAASVAVRPAGTLGGP